MKRKLLLGIIVCLGLISMTIKRYDLNLKKVSQVESLKLWSPKAKLSWKDYQGTPDSTSLYQALTYSRIKYNTLTEDKDILVLNVSCYFNRKSSWSKDLHSKTLLSHEQLHFDIAELITRRIRNKFQDYKWTKEGDTFDSLDIIFNHYVKDERDGMNFLYDEETNHGINKSKQKEWEQKIALELKKMEKYSSTKVIIRRVKK